MKEDFLHYVWKYQKFDTRNLKTVTGESVIVHSPGMHNSNSGPDFFNGQLEIDGQMWAGNIEIHLKASHWYNHKHQEDSAYNNVILHVVWKYDTPVKRTNTSEIPTIELKHWIPATTRSAYKKLFDRANRWIPCEPDFYRVDVFTYKNWLDTLFIERMEHRTDQFAARLEQLNNDWEALLFHLLSEYFGTKVNSDSFGSIATSVNYSLIRKCAGQPGHLEALLLGQAGLLNQQGGDSYYEKLREEYVFLKNKFKLRNEHVIPPKFFRLRPMNFPTIRLSQLSMLYSKNQQLFSNLIEASSKGEYYALLKFEASEYWKDHYNFGTQSVSRSKLMSNAFIDLLLINVVLPLKFFYMRTHGQFNDNEFMDLAQSLGAEENGIIRKFAELRPKATNVLESQALLQLKSEYCEKKQCLRCAIGNWFLKR
ncbi:MAG: DUF2851 family protein [Bacteroidia bacterium]|nr:DUF2851 family protein [Bacteroidia bacterium]NNF32262.1 DUF2851 family protein [Flavobacteriaceae bacterium]MBT8276904.1 DUF2851 family protein [Bacteroidia bacterium]NNJ82904.1 DUF2851 family protein [Flavobacteriaceae bacterium]NNK53779.1 DUF2851 family protein [Flavobacteriaceae bacterium]